MSPWPAVQPSPWSLGLGAPLPCAQFLGEVRRLSDCDDHLGEAGMGKKEGFTEGEGTGGRCGGIRVPRL